MPLGSRLWLHHVAALRLVVYLKGGGPRSARPLTFFPKVPLAPLAPTKPCTDSCSALLVFFARQGDGLKFVLKFRLDLEKRTGAVLKILDRRI